MRGYPGLDQDRLPIVCTACATRPAHPPGPGPHRTPRRPLTFACDTTGAPTNEPPPAAVIQAVGLLVEDTYIVAMNGRLVGY